MAHRSQIRLYKSILKHHFQRSSLSSSPFPAALSHPLPNSSPKPTILAHPIRSIQQSHLPTRQNSRNLSGESGELDQNKEVDMINLKFAEAREEIDLAMESKETVYFNEEAECARAAVKECLDRFQALLARLPESDKAALQRSMGMKMEQLKAELQQLED